MLNFYVYADGSDLELYEAALVRAFSNFAATREEATSVINERGPRTADLREDDLPDWNLGLNFSVATLSESLSNDLVSFLSKLSRDTDRDFVIGLWNENEQVSEDIMFIGPDSSSSSGATLRQIVNGR